MNCENIERNIAPFYMAVMLEIERRRLQLGVSMQEVCDRSGVADYYYSKALHASTPSGRQAQWRTIQDIVDALYPEGYDVEIRPKVGLRLDAEQLRCKIKFVALSRAPTDRKLQRALMSELGRKGGIARRERFKSMTPAQRLQIAKKARKTRRKNRALRSQSRGLLATSEVRP
jgi:transcriptional regulator with XRE-family HTH domain